MSDNLNLPKADVALTKITANVDKYMKRLLSPDNQDLQELIQQAVNRLIYEAVRSSINSQSFRSRADEIAKGIIKSAELSKYQIADLNRQANNALDHATESIVYEAISAHAEKHAADVLNKLIPGLGDSVVDSDR